MKIHKKMRFILIYILSGISFLLLLLPFHKLLSVFTLTEVRPAAVLYPLLGISFGWPAALGIMTANCICDVINGYSAAVLIEGLVPQLIYTMVPYYLWRYLIRDEEHIHCLNSVAGALTTVSDNSTVEAYFSVNEGEYIELASVYGDDAVTKNIIGYPVSLKLKNGTIYAHEGKVVSCSGLIDPLTGTIPIKAEFPNPEGALRSGISGSVVASYEEDNMMVIPQTSVNRMQDKALAYVLQKDSTVKATIVEIEDMNDGKRYAVTKGLNVGDEIVSIGVNNLVDGQKISVKGK